MTAPLALVLFTSALLAFANGANDVSKGIATLVGSGVADYGRAIAWGTAWTAAGGILGAVFGGAMLTTFGAGLLRAGADPNLSGALAALIGASGWVLLATRTGLPVSTTHAIVGSLVGVAALAYGPQSVQWENLGTIVILPLLLSPFAAAMVTAILLRATGHRPAPDSTADDCLCGEAVSSGTALATSSRSSLELLALPTLQFRAGSSMECARRYPAAVRVNVDRLHWLTSGATSLARGMNDGPKMVALAAGASVFLGGSSLSLPVWFALVTAGMVGGSLIAGRRVTHVLAEKVTPMDHREGFTANLVTASLVATGAVFGLPMSTTHVASGGIFSAGVRRSSLNARIFRDILLAWIVTLPGAAVLGISAWAMLHLAALQ